MVKLTIKEIRERAKKEGIKISDENIKKIRNIHYNLNLHSVLDNIFGRIKHTQLKGKKIVKDEHLKNYFLELDLKIAEKDKWWKHWSKEKYVTSINERLNKLTR